MYSVLRQHIREMERYAEMRSHKALQHRCCDVFAAWLKRPESGIRITGRQGFISKTHRDHLMSEVFHYDDPIYVGKYKNEFIVAFLFRPIDPEKPLKIAEFNFNFRYIVTHHFSTPHGRVYLQRMWSAKTERHFYMCYKSHFFDRYAQRVYDNEADRLEAIAYFSAQMADLSMLEERPNSGAKLFFEGGVGLGRRFKIDDDEVIFMNTFITHEMESQHDNNSDERNPFLEQKSIEDVF